MSVVAMRLKMYIIWIIILYHPSYGSSFTEVFTYLQNNSSGCPLSNPRGVRVRNFYTRAIIYLISHREGVRSQGLMGIMPLPLKQVGLEILEGWLLHPLVSKISLHNDGYLLTYMALQGQVLFVSLHPMNTQCKISFGMKICD